MRAASRNEDAEGGIPFVLLSFAPTRDVVTVIVSAIEISDCADPFRLLITNAIRTTGAQIGIGIRGQYRRSESADRCADRVLKPARLWPVQFSTRVRETRRR